MGEIVDMVMCIKNGDSDKFESLLERLKPVINKYSRKLYKDEREDTESELILALWVSIQNIKFFNSEGEVISYLIKAIYMRFLELYRESCKKHMYEIDNSEDIDFIEESSDDIGYINAIIYEDVMQLFKYLEKSKYEIFVKILVDQKSDSQIALEVHKSRQYVNRVRRKNMQ